jgi:hypothetical protein
MNRNIVATIAVVFILLIISYSAIGGQFNLEFWRAALPGLMENLTIAALAAFVFDSLADEPLNKTCHAILLYPLAARSVKHDYRRATQTITVRTIDLTNGWAAIRGDLLEMIL